MAAPRHGSAPSSRRTFVDRDRFTGTNYRAAKWIRVGDTQGRGKTDRYHQHAKPIKTIWVYPLHKQALLTAPLETD
ncbi:MAG: DUF4338 domain-containing protein [Thermaerobacter sp.]|nr:DUF4338 domain-containing protein [Thermaerobacter sp.]